MKHFQIAFVFCAALLLSSCILEERGSCPSYLTLDLSSTPDEVETLYLILQYNDGRIFRDTLYKEELISRHDVAVPRGSASVAAYGNISKMVYDNGYITTRGYPADNIYTYFSKGEYLTDLSSDTISVTKSNMAIHIKVLGSVKASEGLDVEISGTCIGYSDSGEIVQGEFYHTPENLHTPTGEEDFYYFLTRVTRHPSGSPLALRLSTQYPNSAERDTLLEISIHEKMGQAGFSMSDPHLQDLYLTIDQSRSSISISVDDFDSANHVEVEF
jgi:hypothetical protein